MSLSFFPFDEIYEKEKRTSLYELVKRRAKDSNFKFHSIGSWAKGRKTLFDYNLS